MLSKEQWYSIAQATCFSENPHNLPEEVLEKNVSCGAVAKSGNLCGKVLDDRGVHRSQLCPMSFSNNHENLLNALVEAGRQWELGVSRRGPIVGADLRGDATFLGLGRESRPDYSRRDYRCYAGQTVD